jgi:hypothetical protein
MTAAWGGPQGGVRLCVEDHGRLGEDPATGEGEERGAAAPSRSPPLPQSLAAQMPAAAKRTRARAAGGRGRGPTPATLPAPAATLPLFLSCAAFRGRSAALRQRAGPASRQRAGNQARSAARCRAGPGRAGPGRDGPGPGPARPRAIHPRMEPRSHPPALPPRPVPRAAGTRLCACVGWKPSFSGAGWAGCAGVRWSRVVGRCGCRLAGMGGTCAWAVETAGQKGTRPLTMSIFVITIDDCT